MSELRKLCLKCTLKHLGQAIVLLGEAKKGYPMHKYIALGHLAEAEDECMAGYPDTANRIRQMRLSIEEGETPSRSIEDLIEEVDGIKERDGSGCETCL